MVPSYFLSILSRDTTTITSVRHVTLGGDEDFNELRVGGGVEGKFGNVGVRGEYTYTTYEDPDITGWDIDADQHLFRAGVAYYF